MKSVDKKEYPLQADEFEAAVVGVGERCGQMPLMVYSIRKCIDILIGQGMSEDEAREYFEFNTLGAWAGPGTPIWLTEGDYTESTEYLTELME